MEKRLEQFTDERFNEHIKTLIDIGVESDREKDIMGTLYFLTDLQAYITELRKETP